jgi:hypothetical protein
MSIREMIYFCKWKAETLYLTVIKISKPTKNHQKVYFVPYTALHKLKCFQICIEFSIFLNELNPNRLSNQHSCQNRLFSEIKDNGRKIN